MVAAHVTYEGDPDVFSDLEDVGEIIDKTEVQTDPASEAPKTKHVGWC